MARKRELIEPKKGDRRFVRRNAQGQFSEVEDAGRSQASDRRRRARTAAKAGQGDRGDRRPAARTRTSASTRGARKASATRGRRVRGRAQSGR